MERYIKLPSSIFNRGATMGKEMYILCYFYYLSSISKSPNIKVKLPTIAAKAGIVNKDNVIRLIQKLIDDGYVLKEQRRNIFTSFRLANEYTLTNPQPTDFVIVPSSVLDIQIDNKPISGKMLYLLTYLYACSGKGSNSEECYASYVEIKKATGLATSTITRYIKALKAANVITKMNYTRRDNGCGENHYFFMTSLVKKLGHKIATGLKRMIESGKSIYEDLCYVKAVLSGTLHFSPSRCLCSAGSFIQPAQPPQIVASIGTATEIDIPSPCPCGEIADRKDGSVLEKIVVKAKNLLKKIHKAVRSAISHLQF